MTSRVYQLFSPFVAKYFEIKKTLIKELAVLSDFD